MMRILLYLLLVAMCNGSENLHIPNLFSDGMILQAGKPISVWGWAEDGSKVSVRFGSSIASGVAAKGGRWRVRLPAMESNNEPQELTITCGSQKVIIRNVLVGEVWLCAGQSNMEMPLGAVNKTYRGAIGAELLLQDAELPNIRLLQVPRVTSGLPAPDLPLRWHSCTKESAYWFSAVALSFGIELHEKRSVPVGLIHASWGGAGIQRFMPPEGFAEAPDLFERQLSQISAATKPNATECRRWRAAMLAYAKRTLATPPSREWLSRPRIPDSGHSLTKWDSPSAVFNGMIEPLIPYSINGVLWYQGETDLALGLGYGRAQNILLNTWRKRWADDFRFLYVQIAPYDYHKSNWPMKGAPTNQITELWRGQLETLKLSRTGMANTEDLGENGNIHPRDKLPIGKRLASLYLHDLATTSNHSIRPPIHTRSTK